MQQMPGRPRAWGEGERRGGRGDGGEMSSGKVRRGLGDLLPVFRASEPWTVPSITRKRGTWTEPS